jgi:hypothetical protein
MRRGAYKRTAVGRMGRTAVLSGNWYVFYWLAVIPVLIISRAGLPPEVRLKGILGSCASPSNPSH